MESKVVVIILGSFAKDLRVVHCSYGVSHMGDCPVVVHILEGFADGFLLFVSRDITELAVEA